MPYVFEFFFEVVEAWVYLNQILWLRYTALIYL